MYMFQFIHVPNWLPGKLASWLGKMPVGVMEEYSIVMNIVVWTKLNARDCLSSTATILLYSYTGAHCDLLTSGILMTHY